jgi:hypothetical protein
MDLAKLKPLDSRVQVVTVIQKAAPFGGRIWQNLAGGARKIYHLANMQADMRSDDITFKLVYIEELDPKLPIFVNLFYRNIIFRLDPTGYHVTGDKLVCEYPKELRALDPRNGDRYVLPFHSEISLSITRLEQKGRKSVDLEVKIIDVSEKGFGIIISGKNRDFLKVDERFIITAIDNRGLKREIPGYVTYASPKGYFQKKGDMRVGLSLDIPLPGEMFEYLKKKCKIILTA